MLEYSLYHGDCFTVLDKIKDKTVDLVLTDPPYNIGLKHKIELSGRKAIYHNYEELKQWDSIDIKELYARLFPILDRVVKETGSVIIFTRNEYITYAIDAARANNFDVKACIYWIKNNPPCQVRKKNYLSGVETIVWIARYKENSCPFTFNFKTQQEMLNWIQMPICQGKERTEHPSQKPLALIKKLMEAHSNKGDMVLDGFLGSGTTMQAAIELGRSCIGIEVNPKYVQIAKERCGFNNQRLFDNNKYNFIEVNGKEVKTNVIQQH